MNHKRQIDAYKKKVTITIPINTAESDVVDLSDGFGSLGAILVDGWTAANIGFKVSDTESGTFAPLRDSAGAIVQVSSIQAVGGNWYDLPDALNGVTYFKLWSQSFGVDVLQTSARTITGIIRG